MNYLRCNAAAIPLIVFAALLAAGVVDPASTAAAVIFLVVEAACVRITTVALAMKYRRHRHPHA